MEPVDKILRSTARGDELLGSGNELLKTCGDELCGSRIRECSCAGAAQSTTQYFYPLSQIFCPPPLPQKYLYP